MVIDNIIVTPEKSNPLIKMNQIKDHYIDIYWKKGKNCDILSTVPKCASFCSIVEYFPLWVFSSSGGNFYPLV